MDRFRAPLLFFAACWACNIGVAIAHQNWPAAGASFGAAFSTLCWWANVPPKMPRACLPPTTVEIIMAGVEGMRAER